MKTIECLFLVLILAVLAGCGTTTKKTTGRDFDSSKIQDIHKGGINSNALARRRGEPLDESGRSSTEEVSESSWKEATSRATTRSGDAVIATIGDQKTLVVLIKNGVVANYTYKDDPFWDE